jgi:hypothetical protein
MVARPLAATRSARQGAKAGKSTDGARWEAVELTGAARHHGGGGSAGRMDV